MSTSNDKWICQNCQQWNFGPEELGCAACAAHQKLPVLAIDAAREVFRVAITGKVPAFFVRTAEIAAPPTKSSGYFVSWKAYEARWRFSLQQAPCEPDILPPFDRWEPLEVIEGFDLDEALQPGGPVTRFGVEETVKAKMCASCHTKGRIECPSCHGRRFVVQLVRCDPCQGTGKRGKGKCSRCRGSATVEQTKQCVRCDHDGCVACDACKGLGAVADFVVAEIEKGPIGAARICDGDAIWLLGATAKLPESLPTPKMPDTDIPPMLEEPLQEWLRHRTEELRATSGREFHACFGAMPNQPLAAGRTRTLHVWPVELETFRWNYARQRLGFTRSTSILGVPIPKPTWKATDDVTCGTLTIAKDQNGGTVAFCWSPKPKRGLKFWTISFDEPPPLE